MSDAAQDDLDAVQEWIAKFDVARAQSFVDELLDRIRNLDRWPERFPAVDHNHLPGVRRLNHRGYRILYSVAADTVTILHVHHGARERPQR